MGRALLCAVIAFASIASLGCGGGSGSCVSGLSVSCKPLHPETDFPHLYQQTFAPKCNLPSCHAATNPGNGLAFDTEQHAYDLLLGNVGGKARVKPGDPSCSLLVERIESTDPGYVMPRGSPMSSQERCGIELWIFHGAMR